VTISRDETANAACGEAWAGIGGHRRVFRILGIEFEAEAELVTTLPSRLHARNCISNQRPEVGYLFSRILRLSPENHFVPRGQRSTNHDENHNKYCQFHVVPPLCDVYELFPRACQEKAPVKFWLGRLLATMRRLSQLKTEGAGPTSASAPRADV